MRWDATCGVGVAVDTAGNVYVAEWTGQVVKLAAGSSTQTVLPFSGLNTLTAVAVDSAGNVYVTDKQNKRVVKLPAG
jgi:serine/threonine protein kinase, bacterial